MQPSDAFQASVHGRGADRRVSRDERESALQLDREQIAWTAIRSLKANCLGSDLVQELPAVHAPALVGLQDGGSQ